MVDNVELVRQLWAAFETGRIDAVLEMADADVEWEPYGGEGTVFRGHEGLRAYMRWREERNEQTEARLYSAFGRGEAVVARGEVRIESEHGVTTMQPAWLYEFRDGKLVRLRGFPTQEMAMRVAGLAPDDARAVVRDLWDAFNRRDIDRLVELIAEDCEWRPLPRNRVYAGPEGVRDYVDGTYGASTRAAAQEYSLQEIGDTVAVSGSLEVVDVNGGIAQRQVHWLFQVRDGKIWRADAYERREQMPIRR